MSIWHVRHEGSSQALPVSSPGEIVEGLRDGLWLPTDEVRGPTEVKWTPLELHPVFADAANEVEPPIEKADDTHLDMNPLIDVCLVLLIFFILTITYDTLRRAIEIPPEKPDDKGAAKVSFPEMKDRMFKVVAQMDGDKPVIVVDGKTVSPEELAKEIKSVVDRTGRREMLLDVTRDVSWGHLLAIIDAAKGSGVTEILRVRKRGAEK